VRDIWFRLLALAHAPHLSPLFLRRLYGRHYAVARGYWIDSLTRHVFHYSTRCWPRSSGDTTQRRRQRIRLSRSLIRLSSTWPDFTTCGLSPRNDTVSFSCVRKTPMRGWNGYRYWNITRSIWQLCCIGKKTLKQVKTRHRASTSTRWHFVFWLCCHSNETRAPIVNPPNSAQLGGTRYHSLKLHPGPCSSVEMWRGTHRQTNTDTQTSVTNIHFASATPHEKCSNTRCSQPIVTDCQTTQLRL